MGRYISIKFNLIDFPELGPTNLLHCKNTPENTLTHCWCNVRPGGGGGGDCHWRKGEHLVSDMLYLVIYRDDMTYVGKNEMNRALGHFCAHTG